MRINKFVAQATGLSRRTADTMIGNGQVLLNGAVAEPGSIVATDDTVQFKDGRTLTVAAETQTILFNKPVGYIVSRNGQGSRTIYDLLPDALRTLKPIGRLDKDSSGLIGLTSDGDLANKLMHPSQKKRKVYDVTLDKPLQPLHRQMISEHGLQLADGPSKFIISRRTDDDDTTWVVTMHEGRNRQIRRTFQALGYVVVRIHRTEFGEYQLGQLRSGSHIAV
ncbi:pseudouridine synthase [soil metagenome]